MGSSRSTANYRQVMSGGSQFEPSEQVADTVRELHQVLELYAPVWYTEELHDNVEAAVLALTKMSNARQVTQVKVADGTKNLTLPPAYE